MQNNQPTTVDQNTVVLANLVELGFSALTGIAGNAISDQVHGETLQSGLKGILAAKFQQRLSHYKGTRND